MSRNPKNRNLNSGDLNSGALNRGGPRENEAPHPPSRPKAPKRSQTVGEELANAISHGVGLVVLLAMTPFLVTAAYEKGGTSAVIGASIFALTAAMVYLSSTIYHALPDNRTKQRFRILDHAAIFLLIAGSYTPFMLGVLRGAWGFTLLGIVWTLAALGVTLKLVTGVRYKKVSLALYLGMGWAGLIAIEPFLRLMPTEGLLWILVGGIAYTAGVPFYVAARMRYGHFVWHLFVLAGTTCHYMAVLRYAA